MRDYVKVSLLDWTPSENGDSMTKLSLSHIDSNLFISVTEQGFFLQIIYLFIYF